jgi:hypothetical protein
LGVLDNGPLYCVTLWLLPCWVKYASLENQYYIIYESQNRKVSPFASK